MRRLNIPHLIHCIQDSLSDDLLLPMWRGDRNRLKGHCYVASEALYHLLGGRSSGFTSCNIRHEGVSHWYLRSTNGQIVDPTAGQFRSPVPYDQGTGRGFLTRQPSLRAQVLMDRVLNYPDALELVA